jgi:hypothetical protein
MVAGAVVRYEMWRTAGRDEMRAATERVAEAVARADREALATEPILQGHDDTVTLLLRHSPALAGGYRVSVSRNGADGHSLLSPDSVTHLGNIKTSRGAITLGFRYDRETGRLEFVAASIFSMS